MFPKHDPELAQLEELITELSNRSDETDTLLHEHLEAARFYLTGAMPEEYRFNLNLIRGHLSEVQDQELRSRIERFLELYQQDPAKTPR